MKKSVIPFVSLVLSSFNRSKLLDVSLSSIVKNKPSFPFEIIVVNDGMDDSTESICEKYQKELNIKYFFTGQRNEKGLIMRCPSVPNNFAIKQATGDIIILSCAEIFHINHGIDEIVEPLLKNKKALSIPSYMYCGTCEQHTEWIKKGVVDYKFLSIHKDYVKMPFLLGCWKKEILDIGGYDEDFIGYASEDNDFIARLLKNGCTHFRTNAKIIHLYHGVRCPDGFQFDNPAWIYNRRLLEARGSDIVRNVGKEWGINQLEMEKKKSNMLEPIFTKIYENREWNSKESVSGTGSELKATVTVREQLPLLFKKYGIKRVLDIGCGDFNWMKELVNDFEFYLGIDVVADLIKGNVEKYGNDKIQFKHIEIFNLELNPYNFDVVILSDVLVHLSFFEIEAMFQYLKRSNIKYMIVTNFLNPLNNNKNVDIPSGKWRPINLELEPFNFPSPIEKVPHIEGGKKGTYSDKTLDLWELNYKVKEIPKILHLYWDKSPMAWLQTQTVITFHRKNPDWIIRVYVPIQPYVISADKYVPDYTGKDYFYLVTELPYVRIKEIDMLDYGIDPKIHNILQSDIFRYKILYEFGGVWSDFDILWLKSMKYLSKVSVVGKIAINRMEASICYYNVGKQRHTNISVLISVPGHPLYKKLIEETERIQKENQDRNKLLHQEFGTNLLDNLWPNIGDTEKQFTNVSILPYKTFYPYSIYELDVLYKQVQLKKIEPDVLCIHWFNGHRLSKEYINAEIPNPDCSMTKILTLIKRGVL